MWRDRRLTYGDVADRSKRLASYLHGRGLGVHRERDELQGWESGPGPRRPGPLQRQRVPRGDARLLRGPRRPLQRQLPLRRRGAALPAQRRPAPRHDPALVARPDAGRGAAHAGLAPRRAAPGRGRIGAPPPPRGGLVRGGAGRILARRAHRSTRPPTTSTSSTRAAPPACPRACCGASTTSSWPPWAGGRSARGRSSPATRASPTRLAESLPLRLMVLPPLMHGAAQWACFMLMAQGATLLFPDDTRRVDPDDVWTRRRAREGQHHDHRGRRRPAPAAAAARQEDVRPLVVLRRRQRRRAAHAGRAGHGGRAPPQPRHLRLGRLLGDRGADARHLRRRRRGGDVPPRARHGRGRRDASPACSSRGTRATAGWRRPGTCRSGISATRPRRRAPSR